VAGAGVVGQRVEDQRVADLRHAVDALERRSLNLFIASAIMAPALTISSPVSASMMLLAA